MTRPPAERGFVSLVGAGPGDPDLLTRKAADRLADAELVLYDALVDPASLALAPSSAQRVFVGKRAGRPQVRQEFIHWLMIRAARAGKKVVRLKGGDPFVFGRGGEEGLALSAAGVSFEVVPGVSSAIAAAALAGIPVTHRGVASGFVVVSGHADDAYRPILESLAPHSASVVVMMGLGRIERIAELLIGRGWNAMTPAAVIFGASTLASTVWTVTLRDLERLRPGRPFDPSTGSGSPRASSRGDKLRVALSEAEGRGAERLVERRGAERLVERRGAERLVEKRGVEPPSASEWWWAASAPTPPVGLRRGLAGALRAEADKATASSAEAARRRGPTSIENASAPATVIIGDVVRLRAALGAQADADEAAAGGQ